MNKANKIFLSVLGGVDVLITVLTPIFLVIMWLSIFGIKGHWTSYAFIIIGCLSALFRAIKIGWIKR